MRSYPSTRRTAATRKELPAEIDCDQYAFPLFLLTMDSPTTPKAPLRKWVFWLPAAALALLFMSRPSVEPFLWHFVSSVIVAGIGQMLLFLLYGIILGGLAHLQGEERPNSVLDDIWDIRSVAALALAVAVLAWMEVDNRGRVRSIAQCVQYRAIEFEDMSLERVVMWCSNDSSSGDRQPAEY